MIDRVIVVDRLFLDPDADFSAVGELHRVADEVDDDLPQARGISNHVVLNFDAHSKLEHEAFLLGANHECSHRLGETVSEQKSNDLELQLPRLNLGEIENVVDERQKRFGGFRDRLQVLALLFRQVGIESELRHPDDTVQGRPYLMTHVGDELGLEPGCFERRFTRLDQLVLRVLLLGDVSRHADHSCVCLVPLVGDHHRR